MSASGRRRRAAEELVLEEDGGRELDLDSEDSSDDEADGGGLQSTGTVRLAIDRFSDFARGLPTDAPERLSDPPVYICGMPWRILAIPREGGNRMNYENRTSTKHLGFFVLCNGDAGDRSDGWTCQATAQLRVVSQMPGGENHERKIQHTFHAEENDWGYSQFIQCEILLDESTGYIKNDVVLLEVDVSADVVHEFRSPRPTHGKTTVHRFELKDFVERFAAATFGDEWESVDFAVKGVPGAKFFLCFSPKGSDEWADGCGFFLCVRDFGDHPFVRLQFTCWIEDGRGRQLNVHGGEQKFDSSNDTWGWADFLPQSDLTEFARNGPLSACCEVRPLDPIGEIEWAQRTGPTAVCRKIAANFDAEAFADTEVRVQGRVFKVNRMIVCTGSPVFRRMFEHDTKEKETSVVEIKKENAELIELLLRYFYSGQVEGLVQVADRLLPVADCYEVPELAELCMKSLQSQLSVSTILRDLKLAFRHDHQGGFKRKVLAFAHKNLKAVDEHPEWTPQFVSENPEIAMAIVKLCSR